MALFSTLLPVLSLLLIFQSPQDTLRQHYEAAEARGHAGDLAGAQAEYAAILGEAYGQVGKIYLAQKEYQKAVAALEAAALEKPDSQEVLVDLAIAYFDAEQYQKALEPLGQALARNPNSVGAHHMLGNTYFMLGEFTKSAGELGTALKLAPNDYDVAYTLSLVYLKQHQLAPAKQIFDRMIAQLGDRPQLHILFGRSYRETGFLPQAIEELKKAVALDPNFPRAHYYLGLTYLLKDGVARLGDAAEEFRIELKAHPDEFFANYYLGIISIIERKWEPAIGFLQKASESQPNNPDPYFYLGQAYQGVEKHEQAIEALRKAIALNPSLGHNDYQVTTAHFRLGQSLIKTGQTAAGEKELQLASELKSQGFKRDEEKTASYLNASEEKNMFPGMAGAEGVIAEPDAPDKKTRDELKSSEDYYAKVIASAHNNIGLLRAGQQDFRAAAVHFSEAAKWNPQLEGLNFNQGLAYYKAELYKEAIPPLEKEVAAHPANIAAKQLLGLSYFMEDSYSKASPLLADVVAAKPREVSLYYTLALSLIKDGQKEAADRVIQQMIIVGGDSPQLHIILAQAYDQSGDTVKALAELKKASAVNSRTLLAHYYSGLIYLRMGKFGEATHEFESEMALNPGDYQAKYHMGFALLSSQETDRGIKLMREVIKLKPDFGDAYYELGKALLQQGDLKQSVENLEAATKLEPDKPYVHFQLGRAYLAAGRRAEGESQIAISKQLKDKARNQTN